MPDCTALSIINRNQLTPPEIDLSILPARLSKRLWVTPVEFLRTTNAMATAAWAIRISQSVSRRLPAPAQRGPKLVYGDSSILMMAFIQVAWQMGYEMSVDYFRAHPEAALLAAFAGERVVSIGQYWERRQALGIWPFWFFFLGMVWQLIRMPIIHGSM